MNATTARPSFASVFLHVLSLLWKSCLRRPFPPPRRARPWAAVALFLGWLPLHAHAATDGVGAPAVTNNMRATLVSEYAQIEPGQRFLVGMHQDMRPGWHTYWLNPGDSGQATELTWDLPPGWSAGEILWPAPSRVPVGPLVNFGYKDETLLLVELQAPADLSVGQTVHLAADGYWLICDDVCIPEDGRLELTLRVGPPTPGAWFDTLRAARAALPVEWPGGAAFRAGDGRLELELELPDGAQLTQADYFPFAVDSIDNAADQLRTLTEGRLLLELPTGFYDPSSRAGILVLTETIDGTPLTRAYRIDPVDLDPGAGPGLAAGAAPGAGLGRDLHWSVAFAMAVAGGLILNLMPCVFPVLSIKLLSLVQLGGGSRGGGELARHGVVYGAGVLAGFMALAAVLIALRASGVAVGWGFHLQNPVVVLLLAWLFFMIGLNLSGLFEVGQRLMGVGQGMAQGHGLRPSFFTGLLATVVATPCTAPFMGVALGYALVQPAAMSLVIFAGLGIGMALPFVALCFAPGTLARLPAPGPWMVRFKEFLAFPMYASAIWLVWVLNQQIGSLGTLAALGGAATFAFALWIARPGHAWNRRTGWAVAIAGAALWLQLGGSSDPRQPTAETTADWIAYSPAAVEAAREDGPVFVNFTADWCITCKANERVAIETERVRALFEAKGVTRIKADWTHRDATIAGAIEAFNRSGVPLYLFYPAPDAAEPRILPQLLTEGMLVDLLSALPDPAPRAAQAASPATTHGGIDT